MKITTEKSLDRFQPWSGAVETFDRGCRYLYAPAMLETLGRRSAANAYLFLAISMLLWAAAVLAVFYLSK
mgnify:CR=1 FL=1